MRRRAFLAGAGLSVTGSTAGCLGAVPGIGQRELQLAWFGVSNYDPDPHRFDLRVERDGEVVHRSTHDIDGRTEDLVHGESVDCTWDATPGVYEVSVRVDAGAWVSKPLSDVSDGWRDSVTCATAHGWYEDDLWIDLRENCERYWSAEHDVCRSQDGAG